MEKLFNGIMGILQDPRMDKVWYHIFRQQAGTATKSFQRGIFPSLAGLTKNAERSCNNWALQGLDYTQKEQRQIFSMSFTALQSKQEVTLWESCLKNSRNLQATHAWADCSSPFGVTSSGSTQLLSIVDKEVLLNVSNMDFGETRTHY